MNWSAIAFDWNRVRAFLATAQEGSLSAAARALGLTQPTLGRQVAALEEELGVVLFERVGRGLTLTPSWQALLTHARGMAEAASGFSLAATGQSQAVGGLVRITASDVYATHVLPPLIARLRQAAPLIEIDVVAANEISDLQHREADIAIRHVRSEEPELIARLIAEAQAHFYAATSYLDRRGRVSGIADLAGHDFVGFGDIDRMIGYLRPLGLHLTRANFRAGSENGLATCALAQQGLGIAPMADVVAAAMPGIERVLPSMPPIMVPVWLTTHRELHTIRRIRLVFDFLTQELPDAIRE